MCAFDITCQHIKNCNGCKDRYTFFNMYVNIFKTAMDVRIKYVYINVRLTFDKGFYFVTQEILQVEDVIFT